MAADLCEKLSVLEAGSTAGQAKYVYCPMALFAVPPGGASLVPVAIQCGQDPALNPIFHAGLLCLENASVDSPGAVTQAVMRRDGRRPVGCDDVAADQIDQMRFANRLAHIVAHRVLVAEA